MLDVFGFPSPQQSDYQEFYGGGTTRDWVKPRGASMVRFMLIGAGGTGGAGSGSVGGGGGGSGAVTSWIGPAIFVPDVLTITVGTTNPGIAVSVSTNIVYQAKNGTGYTLLTANNGTAGATGGAGGAGGVAMTNNFFGASGIFVSIAGQNGPAGSSTTAGVSVSPSSTTFLSAGASGAGAGSTAGGSVTPNYGYTTVAGNTIGTGIANSGYFITQPILLGAGGAGGSTDQIVGQSGGSGGIGCGGGGSGEDRSVVTNGGDGAVFIWAW